MELLKRATVSSTSEAYAFHALRKIDIASRIAEEDDSYAALLCTVIKCFEILVETIQSIAIVDDAFVPLSEDGDAPPDASSNTRLTVAVSICVLVLRLDKVMRRDSAKKTRKNSTDTAAGTSLVKSSYDVVRRFKGSARFGALCQLFAAIHTDVVCACVLERFNGTANWMSLEDLDECVFALAALPGFRSIVRRDDVDYLLVESFFLEDVNWKLSKHSSLLLLLPLSGVCSSTSARACGKCERPPARTWSCSAAAAVNAKQSNGYTGYKRRRGTQRRAVLGPCNAQQAVYAAAASGEQSNSNNGGPRRFSTRTLWRFVVPSA